MANWMVLRPGKEIEKRRSGLSDTKQVRETLTIGKIAVTGSKLGFICLGFQQDILRWRSVLAVTRVGTFLLCGQHSHASSAVGNSSYFVLQQKRINTSHLVFWGVKKLTLPTLTRVFAKGRLPKERSRQYSLFPTVKERTKLIIFPVKLVTSWPTTRTCSPFSIAALTSFWSGENFIFLEAEDRPATPTASQPLSWGTTSGKFLVLLKKRALFLLLLTVAI